MKKTKTDEDPLSVLVSQVAANPRYREISIDLVRAIGEQELLKRRNLKEAVRETRSKLHQVAVAYQEKPIDYTPWKNEMERLSISLSDLEVQSYCRRMMERHASTHERLPILESFFKRCLEEIAPLQSVFDFACGLNPLTLPWIPLAKNALYYGCDIYQDMAVFLNHFLEHFGIPGKVEICNLIESVPTQRVQVAFLLKTLPCLEQLDKDISLRLLETVQAEYLLISFPAHSLSGRSKGMPRFYEQHFMDLVAEKAWPVKKFEFPTELAFLVHKER
jgi:16S rRNA (guanine(1405)-N(7))-methyltransferase